MPPSCCQLRSWDGYNQQNRNHWSALGVTMKFDFHDFDKVPSGKFFREGGVVMADGF